MKITYSNIYYYNQIHSLLDELNLIKNRNNNDICIGLTGMYANPIHGGHIDLIKHARYQCNFLIVAINNDECSIRKHGYSFVSLIDRMKIISTLGPVSFVIENPYQTMVEILDTLPVNKYFKGGDVNESNLLQCEKDACTTNNIEICYDTGGGKIASSSNFLDDYFKWRLFRSGT